MTISTPTKTTIQVKISEESRTPISQVLNFGSSGDWIIGRSHNVDLFDTLEIWDESTGKVYISPIKGVNKVRVDRNGFDRYIVDFDRFDVTQVNVDFSQKGFRFPGHGVRISV